MLPSVLARFKKREPKSCLKTVRANQGDVSGAGGPVVFESVSVSGVVL